MKPHALRRVLQIGCLATGAGVVAAGFHLFANVRPATAAWVNRPSNQIEQRWRDMAGEYDSDARLLATQGTRQQGPVKQETVKDVFLRYATSTRNPNQVRDPVKIDRLARMPKLGARTIVCVDDLENVADLSAAAQKHGTELEVLVEIDCGAGRCGVTTTQDVVAIARAVEAAPGLKFTGIQAYQGAMQHLDSYADRKAKLDIAIDMVKDAVQGLKAQGIDCELVSGGGTGSYYFESNSGVYNELQCGSYAFMDADYGRILDKDGRRIDQGEWENAFFILTSVMSHAKPHLAVVDAGLKAQSVDSGLPVVFGRGDVKYIKCSDEHGVVEDNEGVLKVGDKLRLIPGHCDPTANVHDWYVGVRNGKVETVWPVSARGKAY